MVLISTRQLVQLKAKSGAQRILGFATLAGVAFTASMVSHYFEGQLGL